MSRIIGIASGKGGVGKTLTAINLGIALQELGEQVTVVDADLTVSNLGVQLGTFSFDVSLQDVLSGKEHILNAVHQHPIGLMVVPSSLSVDDVYTGLKPNAKKLRRDLKKLKGFVILDCPPGLTDDALTVLEVVDDIVVVTNPDVPSVTDAIKVIKITRDLKKNVLGVVVNRIQGTNYELRPAEIEIMCEAPIISKIPEDKIIKKSIFEETPVIKYSPYSKPSIEFRRLAYYMTNRTFKEPKNLFFKRFMEKLRGF